MLVNLCQNIIHNISGEQLQILIQSLTQKQKENLSNLLPLNLPIDSLLTLPLDEVYWKRKCNEKQWTHLNYWLSNCSWKNTFIYYSVVDIIDTFITGKSSFAEVKILLSNFQNYLYILKINGFKFNYSNTNHKYLPLEDFIFQLISLFPNLKEIYLNNFPLNYEMLLEPDGCGLSINSYEMLSKTLIKIQNLHKFHILGTKMENFQFSSIVDSLSALNTLVNVDLSCNMISDDFCDSISKLLTSELEVLKLSDNRITDSGIIIIIASLNNNKSLKTLHLDHNSIGDEGVISIYQCLVSNSSLLNIDLAYNQFTAKCGLSLSMLLKRNTVLEHLNLTGNNLGEETGWKVFKAVHGNRRILYLGYQFCGFSDEIEDLIHLQISQNQVILRKLRTEVPSGNFSAKNESDLCPVDPCQGWVNPCQFCDRRFGVWIDADEENLAKVPSKPAIFQMAFKIKNTTEIVSIIIDPFDIQKMAYETVDKAKELIADKKSKVTKTVILCRWMLFKKNNDKDITVLYAHWHNNGVLPKFLKSWPGLDILQKTDSLSFSNKLQKWCYPKKDAFWKKPKQQPTVEVKDCKWPQQCETCDRYFTKWQKLDDIITHNKAPDSTGIVELAVRYGQKLHKYGITYCLDKSFNLKKYMVHESNWIYWKREFPAKNAFLQVRWIEMRSPESDNNCFLYAHRSNNKNDSENHLKAGEIILEKNKHFICRNHDSKWCYVLDDFREHKVTKFKQKKNILNELEEDILYLNFTTN